MKLSKLFGVVLGLHLGLIAILIVQPGCSSTQPPTRYEQGGVSGLNKAQSLGEVIPENGENFGIDPAFNATPFDDSLRAEPQRPAEVYMDADPQPAVVVTGDAFDTYTVQAGDSMWAIAKKFQLSLRDLLNANGMGENDILSVGRELRIPVQSTVAKVKTVTADVYQPSGYNAETTSYEVVAGDSLSRIAQRFDTSVNAIKAANNKTSDLIRVGEQLLIPVSETAAPQIVAPAIAPADPVPAPVQAPVAPPAPAPTEPVVELKEVPSQPVIEPATEQNIDTNALFEETPEVPIVREGNP
ncbi:MAG: LysM peptidoglycan-binding domain-containing protein [Opitutales bacterium]